MSASWYDGVLVAAAAERKAAEARAVEKKEGAMARQCLSVLCLPCVFVSKGNAGQVFGL